MRLTATVVALALLGAACSTEFSSDALIADDPATPTTASELADEGDPTATPVPTATAAPTPQPTSTAAPTATVAPSPTAAPTPTPEPSWTLTISEIDDETRGRIEPTSWRPGCPVGLEDLRLLRFPHVTFDDDVAMGELIVAADVAEQIGDVFRQLFEAGYPIQRIELVDNYGGNDLFSMQANNTSAFNCREVAGKPGIWSNHALGLAVDLNPLMNPYVSGSFVDPPEGADYLDRTEVRLGMVVAGDPAVQAFLAMGWRWGGNWTGLKDYQHFSHNGR
ncbi:MAG: M15 family metallopeptidase [Actinomycetota bacterium]